MKPPRSADKATPAKTRRTSSAEKPRAAQDASASRLIDQRILDLGDWRGAGLPDPTGLFNASLEGNTRRAIDLREGEELAARAFKTLVKAAVAANHSAAARAKPRSKSAARKSSPTG